MKPFEAAVMGGSGYGGAELIRRLLMHPSVRLARVASVDYVGEPLAAAHPPLEGMTELRFENLTAEQVAEGMDVVLLALPHKVSATQVPKLVATGVRIIDLSGDFRLRDPHSYERFYGARHPAPELLEHFVYGLPEFHREAIRNARWIASPGCFATTIELGLMPLAKAGLLHGTVQVVGMTGSSGSGAAPALGTHHPVRAGNIKPYKILEHQHVPEIMQMLAETGTHDVTLEFVPVSAPLTRGILAISFAHIDGDRSPEAVRSLYEEAYRHEPFVRVPAGRPPEVAAVAGSNHAEIGVQVGPTVEGRRLVTVIAATDNLIKGGAGQAIQCLNLLLGLDERLTLTDVGPWP